jgi:hypothetical protein
MGREKKRKKQARRDHRARTGRIPRQPEGERFSSVGHAIKTGQIEDRPDAARSTVRFLMQTYVAMNNQAPHGPACGGPLLVHADGAFQCTAGCPGGTNVLHVPEALHFCDYADQLGIHADELGHICPQCTATGAAGHAGAITLCTGIQIDHQDGTTTCTLGEDCSDPDAMHPSGQTCGLFEPCDHCGITAPRIR